MLPVHDLFQDYRARRLRFASPKTVNQFEVSIGNFSEFLGSRARTSHFKSESILSAMEWMLARGRSPATVNKFRSNMLALWRFANDTGKISSRPDVDKAPEPDEIPVIWSADQLRTLHDALNVLPGEYGGVPARLFWLALQGVLWDTGERIGAVLQTQSSCVDLIGKTIIFRGATRKHKKRDRIHPLHATTCEFLRELTTRPMLFGVKYHAARLYYRKVIEKVGLPLDRKHLFQCMRRTTGSFYEAAGGNATELLDHSSRAITVKYYLNPSLQPLKGPAMMRFRPEGPDRAA